ncbi:ATP binding, partial [Branchiostoma belcheri]
PQCLPSGKTPPSKLVVNLDNFLAPPDTEWVVLEDAEDAATFIDTYIKIRQELRKGMKKRTLWGQMRIYNSGSGREKEDLEENMEEEERDGGALGQDALEDEGEGEPNPIRRSKMLDKNAGGWRTAVAALLGTALHKVSSNMATYVTVATLSPRCYQEALDIMSKWSSGECRGQGKSLKVTQTIFKELNGMGKELEDDIYSLLHRLNHGEIEKEEFDTEAKAKKKNCASRSKSKPSKEVTDGEVQELKKEKEKTEGEEGEDRRGCEGTEEEKEKTEQELSDLKKEKEKAEGKDDQKIVASLRAEIASVQAEKRELEKKRRPSEEEQPVSKRSKTVSNWEGKAIEPGQLVAVAFSAPRRFHIGKVLEVDIEKQYSVHVQFYKPARKILENYGEPEWTKPQFVLDTSVDVPKDGVTLLPVSKSEQGRLKEKAKQFWSVESK